MQISREAEATVKKVIKQAFMQSGKSDNDLAIEFGKRGIQCTHYDVKRWRKGENIPTTPVFIAIAQVHNIDVSQIPLAPAKAS